MTSKWADERSTGDERYLKLKDDTTTRFRILDEAPVRKFTHWFDGGPYNCPGIKGGCPACKANKVARDAWDGPAKDFKAPYRSQRVGTTNVLVYGDKPEVKIYAFGQTVADQFAVFDSDKELGDLRDYDITIRKTKTGTRTLDVKYQAVPREKSALSAELQAIAETKFDLEKEAAPASVEAIAAAMKGTKEDTVDETETENEGRSGGNQEGLAALEKLLKTNNLEYIDLGIDNPKDLTPEAIANYISELAGKS